MFDFVTIRALSLIEQNRSVTKTSESLGYSQPAISQRLARAEQRLGLQLIKRQGNTVTLTEAGQVLADVAPRIEDALEDARLGLSDLATLRTGSLTLSGPPSVSATFVPVVLGNLQEARPGVQVSYIEAEPSEARDLMRERRIDVAVTCTYPGEPEPSVSGMFQLPLFRDSMFAIMPSSHPLAGQNVVDLAALRDDAWIAGCPLCRGFTVKLCNDQGFNPRVAFATDNYAAVVGFVARGLGVSIVPALVLRTVAIPDSVVIREIAPPASRTFEIIADPVAAQTPAIRAMIRLFRALDPSAWGLQSLTQ